MAEEVAARAHSQWALMEAADLQAAAAETAAISKVESALPAPCSDNGIHHVMAPCCQYNNR